MISKTQNAFVPGQLIMNNILVAFETLHHMQTTRHGRQGHMALKLDMSKAYDRVEWAFLALLMSKMGFNTKFIALIVDCISTISYSILINGIPHENFTPTRGIRQGDPLSPYLFILCAKGLHYLLKKDQMDGSISGVFLCRNGPRITHLFFTDNSLLFCRETTREECQNIQDNLSLFEAASGQQLNREKTTLYFSKNTSQAAQEVIKLQLNVLSIHSYEKYLGLPSFIGRQKKTCFS